MNRRPQLGFYLAFFLLLAFSIYCIRIDGYAEKRCLYHDEGVSYLCAAGKEGFYDNEMSSDEHPANRWAKTEEWLAFYVIEEPFDFDTIRRDLIVNDVHPPFYFWSLHAFGHFAGIDPRTGPRLNTTLHMLSFCLFFLLLRSLTENRLVILAVLALWTLSPSVVGVTFIARQYELSTLLFLASLLLLVKSVTTKGKGLYFLAGLLLVLFLGMLTHYQFIYVSGIVVLLTLTAFFSGWIEREKMLSLVGTALLSFGLFIVVQPEFFAHIRKFDQWNQSFSFSKLLGRCGMAVIEAYQFFALYFGANVLSVTVLLLVLFGLARLTLKARREGQRKKFLVMLAFWLIAGVIFLQYFTFLSPWHAMEDRYLAHVWPLWSMMLIFLVDSIPGSALKNAASGAIVVGMVVVGYLQHDKIHYLCNGSAPYLDLLPEYDTYLVDAPHRGRMPRIMVNFEDGKEIFVATQHALLENPGAWMTELRTKKSAFYISMLGYGNNNRGREIILSLLRQDFDVIEMKGGRYAGYALSRRESASVTEDPGGS